LVWRWFVVLLGWRLIDTVVNRTACRPDCDVRAQHEDKVAFPGEFSPLVEEHGAQSAIQFAAIRGEWRQ